MPRQLPPLITTLMVLLTVTAWSSATRSPVIALARAHLATPEASPPSVPLPALSVAVVVERTQAAVQQAGTYRYELSVTGEPESTKSADNPWGTLTLGGRRHRPRHPAAMPRRRRDRVLRQPPGLLPRPGWDLGRLPPGSGL